MCVCECVRENTPQTSSSKSRRSAQEPLEEKELWEGDFLTSEEEVGVSAEEPCEGVASVAADLSISSGSTTQGSRKP